MNYREMNAPDLVKQWKNLVNDNVMMGRDSHLMKEALIKYNSVQILLGMYRTPSKTITIPQFLRKPDWWLEDDEYWAEVELCVFITRNTPTEYYTYLDLCDEETPFAFQKSLAARLTLQEWADKVLA